MRSITAVEIGADICALARTSVKGGEVHLWAAETLDPAAFPGVEAFTLAVRQSRRTLKLPRRCRAVVWGLPDGARRRDPIVAPLIEPLTRAGFRVARVVTPCNALGALARLRVSRTGGAMCWLGINRNGVAIVVVRPGKLLYSHSFAWDSNVGASGSQARLLQRYSLVAFLAPEVRRALAAARQKGTTVDGIVTCGNLPDLRSLTMPLIEELDIEVETLDSLEGLVVPPESADKLMDAAPSLRLACAGAIARETRSLDETKRRRARQGSRAGSMLRVAALLALLAGAAYWFYWRARPASSSRLPASSAQLPASRAAIPPNVVIPPKGGSYREPERVPALPASGSQPPAPGSQPPASSLQPPAPGSRLPASGTLPPAPAAPQPNPVTVKPAAPAPNPVTVKPAAPAPSPVTVKPAAPGPSPVTVKPAAPAPAPVAAATPVPAPAPAVPPTSALRPPSSDPRPPTSVVRPPSSAPGATEGKPPAATGTLSSSPPAADKPVATPPVATAVRPDPGPMPALLKDPVPRVTAILVSADRRLATIGDEGQIIGVGDTVGRRVVVAIDDQTVLFREPSGVQIRVGLGGRVVGVERAVRLP